jgi:hypothetical protein
MSFVAKRKFGDSFVGYADVDKLAYNVELPVHKV